MNELKESNIQMYHHKSNFLLECMFSTFEIGYNIAF